MSLGLAGLYQKNIPESSRVQLYTQGEAGSGVSLRDKPLLLARVSNDIILSGMSYALWVPRWVSTLQPLSVTTCLHLAEWGLAGLSLLLSRFCHLCTYVWCDAGNKEVRDNSGGGSGLAFIHLSCAMCSLYNYHYFQLFIWYVGFYFYICLHVCVCMCICLLVHVLVQAYGSPRLMLGVFLCCPLPYSLRSSNWTQDSPIWLIWLACWLQGAPAFTFWLLGL